ncbi:SRPBCC domain-containing protein [Occallatibacter riparius]|uniref:SRPBCC domain-containing protein n=1 Tax=Occallatibacter riparius TaxID=1002689 RepID=A0A9J7BJV3_9BACT|nr:SRPBCC domain-containing protein [Occallatibacter riparius]UWZ82737.1 SRPBCC domain-containing protein [Occallatibacter riparius]
MADPKVIHSTFVLERKFSKPAATVFAALSEPEKVRQWFTDEKNSETLEFSLRFAVGGSRRLVYRLGPTTPVAGMVIINDGYFQDIVPNERIVTATTMTSGDKRLEASLTTFELLPSDEGTDLVCTVQGAFFEGLGPDPVGLIKAGWNGLLNKLMSVVNAE